MIKFIHSNQKISCIIIIYYINTSEIPSEAFPQKLHIFTCEDNMLSSHVKRSPSLWLHNKLHLWKQADLVFHWCLYNKQNITYLIMDINFIFLCSTRYLEILSWPLKDKIIIHIHAQACNILYLSLTIDLLPVGLVAQQSEHCTDITEVKVWIPVQAFLTAN